jgi:threonine dehydrogenase-like Zn-dependent dehydrogenase
MTSDEIDIDSVPAQTILMKTHYSLISPGTEIAVYKGLESWAKLPYNSGYAATGEVVAVGEGIEDFAPGDRILSYSAHSQYSIIGGRMMRIKLPKDCDLQKAVFTRLASISITALRVSNAELGDKVAVFGMGLIGNLAAQLFTLSGAEVTGIDLSDKRLALAKQIGISDTINSSKINVKEILSGINTAVEATGMPEVTSEALEICGSNGEVILLGSPRRTCEKDITPMLNQVHLWPNGCVSLKGAHEFRYPRWQQPEIKHSIQGNCNIIADLIAKEKLKIKPLISHVVEPQNAQEMFQGLLNDKDKYMGIVFDWTKV